MKHFNLVLFFMAVSCCYSMAQKIVSGVVKDENGEPLPGATIIEKGTQNGTITDAEGNYSLSVDDNATIIVSFIGYITEEVGVGAKSRIDLSMRLDVKNLGEVVIIGYGEQKKASVLSAIDKIEGKKIQEMGSPNLVNALSGLSPGLNVVIESGQPGGEDGEIYGALPIP